MRTLILTTAATLALVQGELNHPINNQAVSEIKSKTDKWTPHPVDENPLRNYTHAQLHGLLGTILKPPQGTMIPRVSNVLLPQNFDPRVQWADCIHSIRNQEKCGSCWAFAASEAFSDRVCIATKGQINQVFSPESLVECDKTDFGCDGGQLSNVWKYLETTGVVTDDCKPYIAGDGKVPQCVQQCQNPEQKFEVTKCQAGSVVEAITPEQIKEQLFQSGPMETGFEVYHDFFNYKSGIYHHVTGELAGGHAVKILGWGTDEQGTDFWICGNSWGPEWGESGYFRIKTKEGGIDQSVWGCTPDVKTTMTSEIQEVQFIE